MQRRVRTAWIAGLAAGLLAAGCAGTPAPRPSVEDATENEAVDIPRHGGDERRRHSIPRRVERTSQRQDDPEPARDEPGAPIPPADEPAPPTASPGEIAEAPSPARGRTPGEAPRARPRDDRDLPPAPACPDPEVVTAQADLVHAAATRSGRGFAGLALSAADCRIDLWWEGPVPPTVVTAVAAEGVHVVTHDAAHSAAELATAADALTAERLVTLPGSAPVTVAVEAVTPRHDGAGIDVEISADPGLAERVAASLTEHAGVPVFVEVVADPPVALDGDEPHPHPAPGERSYHPVPGRPGAFVACTTGFDVRDRHGERWLLTADHCTAGADGPAFDSAHAPIGDVTEHQPTLDSTRIPLAATGTPTDADARTGTAAVADAHAGEVADADTVIDAEAGSGTVASSGMVADVDAGTGVGAGVGGDRGLGRGAGANYVGKRVCQGGATSGEVCDLVIRQVGRRQWSEPLGTYVREVVQAEHADGAQAARPGDSGAPVYRMSSTGEVEAHGILVMGHTRSLLDSPVDTIYYVDIRALLAEWNVELDVRAAA
jgi:hypothetical protein